MYLFLRSGIVFDVLSLSEPVRKNIVLIMHQLKNTIWEN
jgi:hypothetical protein